MKTLPPVINRQHHPKNESRSIAIIVSGDVPRSASSIYWFFENECTRTRCGCELAERRQCVPRLFTNCNCAHIHQSPGWPGLGKFWWLRKSWYPWHRSFSGTERSATRSNGLPGRPVANDWPMTIAKKHLEQTSNSRTIFYFHLLCMGFSLC